ncbi:MAG: 16S rRNA (guanine(527)-N(7))-methyltransferase RsmG [Alphaproteobacteria bacterium]
MADDAPLSPEEFQTRANVSRETMDRLRIYADLLTERQQVQNLVSRNSLEHLWDRHMLDSSQLADHLPEDAESVTDIGSGAGFPGLVLAIVTGLPVTLVESHGRKCAFLQDVIDATEATATVANTRIEAFASESAKKPVDILTARALAPLAKLCEMADSLGARMSLFQKGARWQEELTDARKGWKMQHEAFESRTSSDARILLISHLARR